MAFPLDIQFVTALEAKLGRKLPLGYVAKMCRDNGGEVAAGTDHWWLYPIFDDSDRKRLKRTCNDIVRETASAREWPDFPAEASPLGTTAAAISLFCWPTRNRIATPTRYIGGITRQAS